MPRKPDTAAVKKERESGYQVRKRGELPGDGDGGEDEERSRVTVTAMGEEKERVS